MPTSRRRRVNLLGVLSIVAGIAGCAALRAPIGNLTPLQLGGTALGLALLGLLSAAAFGRWGSSSSALGLLISLVPIGWSLNQSGPLMGWEARLYPPAAPPPAAAPAAPTASGAAGGLPRTPQAAAPTAAQVPPANIGAPPRRPDLHSIFDDDDGSPAAAGSPAGAGAIGNASDAVAAPEVPGAAELHGSSSGGFAAPSGASPLSLATISEARARLGAARLKLLPRLESDPAYVAAKAEADARNAARQQALQQSGVGSPEVVYASQQWINARGKLHRLVSAVADADPETAAAQRALRDAVLAARGKSQPPMGPR